MANAKVRAILSEVLSAVKPSSQEVKSTRSHALKVIARINKALGADAKATIQGSFRKNTQLRHVFDIDIFVHFDYRKYVKNDKAISGILEKKLKKVFRRVERLHGSRDYFMASQQPYTFEIIPILRIKSSRQAKNITDVSPLHSVWIGKNSHGKLDEIRLTKAFLKAQGIYGAESYVKGFSGYASEILTIHHGSFLKLLIAASKWKGKVVIDPENAYKNDNPLLKLNKSKTASPLVLIDPVQPSRNVTAALSKESFDDFVKAAKKFLNSPSAGFFKRRVNSREDLLRHKRDGTQLLIIELNPEKGKHDVVGAAILKKHQIIKKALAGNKFRVNKSGWFWERGEKGAIWCSVSKKLPGKFELREGPLLGDGVHAARFKAKHKNAFAKGRRLYAKVPRRFLTPRELIRHVVKQPAFREKIRGFMIEWH